MTTKDEALRLAGQLESGEPVTGSAAAELRRLYEVNQELLGACMAMTEWDDREKDHAVDFRKRMELCEQAFQKARAAIAKATGENT